MFLYLADCTCQCQLSTFFWFLFPFLWTYLQVEEDMNKSKPWIWICAPRACPVFYIFILSHYCIVAGYLYIHAYVKCLSLNPVNFHSKTQLIITRKQYTHDTPAFSTGPGCKCKLQFAMSIIGSELLAALLVFPETFIRSHHRLT
jgi:hypothetical protein